MRRSAPAGPPPSARSYRNTLARADWWPCAESLTRLCVPEVAAPIPSLNTATTTASTATKALGTIEADAEAHPIAFGAIPFIGDSQARFVVPAITVEKTDSGATLVTSIAEDRTAALQQLRSTTEAMRSAARPRSASASSYSVAPLVAVETYLAAVATARDAVRAGHLTKAVIARDIQITSDAPIDIPRRTIRERSIR